jgi:regulator of replication initiation timing
VQEASDGRPSYDELVAVVGFLKQRLERVEQLEARVVELEVENAALRAENAELKAKLGKIIAELLEASVVGWVGEAAAEVVAAQE